MPQQPMVITPLGNMTLSEDARNVQENRVITGRNFLWDSKGPKSGFSTKELSPFPIGSPVDAQGIRIEGRAFLFAQDSILTWREEVPYMWDPLVVFDSTIPLLQRDPWNALYIENKYWFAQRFRGMFEGMEHPETGKLSLRARTSTHIPGLIEGIRAMEIVRGRPILVSDTVIQWGNVGIISDLTPDEGGPGIVAISEFTKGTFTGLVAFGEGFVVHTTEGSIVAEFIGGPATWRFYAGSSKESPIGPWATERLSNGASVFLSAHGLMTAGGGRDPQPWTPEFNEFFRQYLLQVTSGTPSFRLEYDLDRELIYIMESTEGTEYWRTWVLAPTLDRWGVFNESVCGIGFLNTKDYGYVDSLGRAYVFVEQFWRSVEPANERGANRHYPRYEKGLQGPSSSAVSRNVAWNLEAPLESPVVPAAAWYLPGSVTPAALDLAGMDSWIEIGFMRPQGMTDGADSEIEIQELLIGSIPSLAPETPGFYTQHRPHEYFYFDREDWSAEPLLSPIALPYDLDSEDGYEDLEYAGDYGHIDMEYLTVYDAYFDIESWEDWNLSGPAEDWNGPQLALNRITHKLSVLASTDGITFDEYTPVMARFNTAGRLFTTWTSGVYNVIRLAADEPGEYYHAKLISLTIEYGGQII